ncbi:class I adenylate-forming enzyme family protein [Janthinobacterium sp. 17J80-10]|uniref:class I adenylate-forming enzyme family protein n=1 Tax=Janthinobacterium sp. 17J80-10 TaxID=2497863 RepID=UPI0010059D61|nr:class I adenylate-forming enzyme family protein [Janthinobacterium sp. 17J80-10]QAU34135.1 long-chain fatty acid--CoA ligase [Janthinobacterium sp. 17J80-10]
MATSLQAPPIRPEAHFDERMLQCYADRHHSLYAMFEEAVRSHPAREALVCGVARLTWRDLQGRVERISAGLAQAGICQGDRVAILLNNQIEFVEATLAISRLGAIVVPISTRDQTPGIAHILNDCGAALLIHDVTVTLRLPAMHEVPELRACIPASMEDAAGTFAALRRTSGDVPVARVDEDDTAAILYTSGTTGKPKGAMLAHLNIVHSAMHYGLTLDLTEHDRLIAAVPLSHVTGLVALMATAIRCAGTLVILPAFRAAEFLALAARERMTYTLMVPAMYNLCLIQDDCSRYDLASWRIGAFGGAIMPQATIEAVAKFLPGLTLVNVYGATETTSPATIMPPGAGATYLDSVGRVVPCGEIVMMDDAGRQVPPRAAGELWIRGPMVVRGYWNNPAATAESFDSGFWKSGDIGSIDDNGFVSVFDRKKDMINRGGFKIYSSEVENVLCQHPGVFEAAVVGKPCPVLGERVHAFVVLKDVSVTDLALKAFCAERLTDYQVPESFSLGATPLPRNANGKMLKRELRLEKA